MASKVETADRILALCLLLVEHTVRSTNDLL